MIRSSGNFLAGDQLRDHAALLDLGVDRVAVEQVEGLRERRLHLHLARAGRLAGGPAEGGEEVGRLLCRRRSARPGRRGAGPGTCPWSRSPR